MVMKYSGKSPAVTDSLYITKVYGILYARAVHLDRVIYKEIRVPIMTIEQTIFARSKTILSDQNAFLLSCSIMEEALVKILLDQDDRANKFCPIICVFARSYDR